MKGLKRFLLGAAFALCAGSLFAANCAWADVAYTTSDYASGTIGVIGKRDGDLRVASQASNFGGDAVAFGYSFGNRLLVADRSSAGTSNDGIFIYDPADIAKPIVNTTWAGARNIYDAEYMFGYLYVICYNDGKVIKIETENFTKVGEYVFENNVLPEGYRAHGVSITQHDGNLYALFAVSDSSYPPHYQQSRLVKLGDDLTRLASMQLPANAHRVLTWNYQVYVVSWGGPQTADADGSASRVQRINTSVMGESGIIFGSDLDGGLIASLCFAPDGTALVATHKYDSNFNTTARIYRLDSSMDPNTRKLVKTLDGWSTHIIYDQVTKLFWVVNANGKNGGDQLLAVDPATGSVARSFSASELGGPAYFAAPVKQTGSSSSTEPGDGSSGGGCSTGGGYIAAITLLLAIGWTIRRK